MALRKSPICLMVIVLATGAIAEDGVSSFSKWLGPQSNEKATLFAPVVGKPIDRAKHEKLSRYEITLEIVKGTDLILRASENAIVTLDNNGFRQTKDFQIDEDATYLLGKMQLRKDELGWRFYTLNLRVTDGNLKGAIVHLRDGKIQDSITDPCVAIYRKPDDFRVKTGKVPFEVVALFAK